MIVAIVLTGCGGGSSGPTAPTGGQPPTANAATGISTSTFTANWIPVGAPVGYRLDVSTSGTFGAFIAGYQDRDVGSATSWSVSGLTPNTPYFYRVRAVYGSGPSGNSGTISVSTLPAETCAGDLSSTGQKTCTFSITSDGHQVIATLTALSGSAAVGVLVGSYSGSVCNPVTTVDGATVGTRVVGPAFPVGTGCVRVYTPRNVPAPVTFSIAIEHW